jgi:CBS domain-containing protein
MEEPVQDTTKGLTPTVFTVGPDAPLSEVAGLLASHGVGAVVVVEDRKPVGIVTDRDLAVQLAAPVLDPRRVQVKTIMSQPLVTVTREDEVSTALALMRRHRIRRLPIVNDEGHLCSIFTLDDALLLHLEGQGDLSTIVKEQLQGEGKESERRGEPGEALTSTAAESSTGCRPVPAGSARIAPPAAARGAPRLTMGRS